MAESEPESPLSSLDSGDESDNVQRSRPSMDVDYPSKRRKTETYMDEDDTELSEDTEGSAPGSPSHDEYAVRADQVTVCQWEGCTVGDLKNSDDLIRHVQDMHISPKRARYTCEWGDCARKGTNHPSGYALKAHMRSHTKEKPFFCTLPECDRSFTRSDALAKHMRTVHEPEPPRNPIDPATGQPKKGPKLRLMNGSAKTLEKREADSTDDDPSPSNDNIKYIPANHPLTGLPGFMITYPPDIFFSPFESGIPADALMRLIRRQVHWAKQEGERLQEEIEQLETLRREEWIKKEVLLEGLMEAELAEAKEKDLVTNGLLDDMSSDVANSDTLKWTKTPWWSQNRESDAADVLMGLSMPGK